MSASSTNVVNLVPRTLEQVNLAKRRLAELTQDQQSLTELSLHLRGIKRELAVEVSVFDAAGSTAGERHLKLQANAFLEQIEALEAGMNKLIGAMAAYQPR